jgi:hypothetical protein
MVRTDAMRWLLSACAVYLRPSQAKTLVTLARAATRCTRISLANLGRGVAPTTTVKHRIKRVWRFIANDRVEPTLAVSGVVQRLLADHPSSRPLLISFDWTDIRGMQTLVAALNLKGRALPVAWASCRKHVYDGHRSRNAFEESLLLMLRQMIPRHLKVILLADRGFGRTELGRFCQRMNFHYVIRIQGKVQVTFGDQQCRLDRYPIAKGKSELLRNVLYRRHDPIRQHVVIRWKRRLPPRRDEPWYLMTNLPSAHGRDRWTARRLSDLYGRRMSIEQLFRDGKSKRNGWSLRDTGLRDPARLDRLILVLALAYLLLMGVGLVAQKTHRPGAWSSNQREDAASLFQIGQWMLQTVGLGLPILKAVKQQLATEVPKWG